MSKKVRRLFEQFQPDNYELYLHPDAQEMKFSGVVKISGFKKGRPSKRLTLHQSGLIIESATLTKIDKKGSRQVVIDRINTQKSYSELRVHCTEMLYPGKYIIEIRFSGKITRPMHGLYPCFFKDNGIEKKLLATQFESHDAREVFPCIDEPEAKATFDLTLKTLVGVETISNTPIKFKQPLEKWQDITFETTPIMSTYLLAFVIGEMKYLEKQSKQGTVVRVYATDQQIEHGRFALDFAVKCLDFYNEYFGIAYPLQKCDLIALPDFSAGAMENWGCITFREHALLVNEQHTSLAIKQYVAMVIAHELAHQWFGNLVTMKWWQDLWLNEGFASWVEHIAIDHIFPDWQIWTQFIFDEQQQSMKLDALQNTHPIEVPINHPDEIRTVFDAISYSKGASVIHMLHSYLGPDVFRDGLRNYLIKHSYKNTETIDLWTALEEISSKPVKSFMHKWTSQSGFPIVYADVSYSDNTVALTQKRFCQNPLNKSNNQKWPIIITKQTASDNLIFDKHNNTIAIDEPTKFKLNNNQSGFYRVAYNTDHLINLGQQVQNGQLAAVDRIGLLSDAFEASKAGYIKTTQALKLLESYKNEDDHAVWDVISSALSSIRLTMDDEDLRNLMKPFIRTLCAKQLKRLGWQKSSNEAHFDTLMRPTILGLCSWAEEENVVRKSIELFSKVSLKNNPIDPDLRSVVYSTVVRNGGQKEFDKLLQMHNMSTSSEEQNIISSALTGFRQPEIIQKSLKLILSEQVRSQDVVYWISYSFFNRFAKKDTWQWLKTNWDELEKQMEGDLSFYRMPLYPARVFSDKKFLQEYDQFFADKNNKSFERSIKQGREIIQWQSEWKKRDLKDIIKYFSA